MKVSGDTVLIETEGFFLKMIPTKENIAFLKEFIRIIEDKK